MKTLIVGHSSGLGFRLATTLLARGHAIHGASRRTVDLEGITDHVFDACGDQVAMAIATICSTVGHLDAFYYVAGAQHFGHIDDFAEEEILRSVQLNISTPMLWIRELLRRQNHLKQCVLVTSTSAFVPREQEPVYAAAKAGLRMFGRSLALDSRVESVVIAAPAGMVTGFWLEDKDVSDFLDPGWVAEQIIERSADGASLREFKLLRNPPRTEDIQWGI